jgi:hypothetical protein
MEVSAAPENGEPNSDVTVGENERAGEARLGSSGFKGDGSGEYASAATVAGSAIGGG